MSAPETLPACFWLTRDTIFGELSSRVDVWAVQPIRADAGGGDWMWKAPDHLDVDNEPTCLGDWSLAEARRQVGNGIPDAFNQSIRVGEPAATEAVS